MSIDKSSSPGLDLLLSWQAAWIFLTRLPLPARQYPEHIWPMSTLWFPLVGLCLGCLYSLLTWLLSGYWPILICVLSVMGFGLLLTGGLHEDGLADTADALGGGYTPDQVLQILKDSRIGTYGTLALIIALGLKAALLVELDDHIFWGWVLGQSLSRGNATLMLLWIPYVNERQNSKSKDIAQLSIKQALFTLSCLCLILGVAVLCGLPFITAVQLTLAMALTNSLLGWRFKARVNGLTGDFLGCTQQISEIMILLVLVMP